MRLIFPASGSAFARQKCQGSANVETASCIILLAQGKLIQKMQFLIINAIKWAQQMVKLA